MGGKRRERLTDRQGRRHHRDLWGSRRHLQEDEEAGADFRHHLGRVHRRRPDRCTELGGLLRHRCRGQRPHHDPHQDGPRCAESAKIDGIDDGNLKQAIDGHTKKFKRSVIEYLLANHSTTTELTWDGTVIENFGESTRTLTFDIKNATNSAEDSLPSMLVIYHTDTHEFEEADVQ